MQSINQIANVLFQKLINFSLPENGFFFFFLFLFGLENVNGLRVSLVLF